MPDFNPTQSGDFDDGATYGNTSPGVEGTDYPGSGDTLTVSGTYTITVPSDYSGTGCGAISLSGTNSSNKCVFINQSEDAFNSLGDVTCANNYCTVRNQGLWDLNNNDILFPDSADNLFECYGDDKDSRARFISTGAGTSIIQRSTGVSARCNVNIQYADFVDTGIKLGNNYAPDGLSFVIDDATFTDAPYCIFGGVTRAGTFTFKNITFYGSAVAANGTAFLLDIDWTTGGTTFDIEKIAIAYAERRIVSIRGDGAHMGLDTWVMENVSLDNTSKESNDSTYSGCLYTCTDTTNFSGKGISGADTMDGCYFYSDADNVHFGLTGDTITDNVCECAATSGDGHDIIFVSSSDITITGNIVTTKRAAVFINALGSAQSGDIDCNHNTIHGPYAGSLNTYGALARTESGGSFTGTNVGFHSNIIHNTSGVDTDVRGFNMSNLSTIDQITFMENNFWHDVGAPYHLVTHTSLTPGVSVNYGSDDQTGVDGGFVDPDRNLADWDAEEGSGTGTAAAGIDYLLEGLNGYDPVDKTHKTSLEVTERPSDLVTYVRDGFKVTNSAFENAGYDGVTVGAMEYQAPQVDSDTVIQGQQLAAYRAVSSTTNSFNEDAMAAFGVELGDTNGTYNELLARYLQSKLSSSTNSLPDLMAEAAADRGVSRFQEISDITAVGS